MNSSNAKGFTLIELLVVIAIVAILSVVVILTLNPAELLRQARDSNRISDLATVKSAISLYMADVSSISLGTDGSCYMARTATSAQCGSRYVNGFATPVASTTRGIAGNNGWIPVNFSAISSGAPLSQLPIDPLGTADTTYFYSYAASSTGGGFEITAKMESQKYGVTSGSEVESTDGGNQSDLYESGTNLAF